MTIKPDSAAGAVVRFVKEGISTGLLRPGQHLGEKELSERCGVGRSSVREGLRALAADGLVQVELHRGATIRAFSRDEALTHHRIQEVLEGLAAALAADRFATSPLADELLTVSEELRAISETGDQVRGRALNMRFHELIVLISGSGFLQENIDRTRMTQIHLRAAPTSTMAAIRRSQAEHDEVIDAIRSADADRAEEAMRRHVRGTRRHLDDMEQLAAISTD